jgi:predicted RNA-binding protein YlxR (DUF448 family)
LDASLDKPGPVRRCVACQGRRPKDKLLRFVAKPGGLIWDEKKQMPGRGYYLCQNEKCIGLLADSKKVTKAFRLAACHEDTAGLQGLILERIQGASDGQNAGI